MIMIMIVEMVTVMRRYAGSAPSRGRHYTPLIPKTDAARYCFNAGPAS